MNLEKLNIKELLPSTIDDVALLNNMAVLVERILVANMKYLSNTFNGIVLCHIQHTYSEEMIQKSTVVKNTIKF